MNTAGNVRRRRAAHGIVMANVIRDGALSANARLLYAILTTYANGGGESFPKTETILDGMGLSDSTRKRAQAELVAAGCLVVTGQVDAKGRQIGNLYTLTDTPDGGPVDNQEGGLTGEPPIEGVTGEPLEGVTGEPAGGSPVSPPMEGVTGEPPRTTIRNIAQSKIVACVHGRPPHMCASCAERHIDDDHPRKCEHNHVAGRCPWCPGGRLAHLEPARAPIEERRA